MKRYFVTGTDTDCGKTFSVLKLLDLYPASAAIKPVASGCRLIDNQLHNDDVLQLMQRSPLSEEQINPWRFALPVSPHLAAKQADSRINTGDLVQYCVEFDAEGIETLFIEGAGGLMVPINDEDTWVDFLQQSRIPVILVVGMKLGCINHALLTQEVLETKGITCAGWIANCLDADMLALNEVIETLAVKLKYTLLMTIPYQDKDHYG